MERLQKRAGPLEMFVVYRSPSDNPGKYVVRRWWVGAGSMKATSEFDTAESLVAVRRLVPTGLTKIARHPTDDAVIVESWV